MAEVLLSPGIQINETDQSFVPARPLVAGAAIIGPTVKGPAGVPIKVTSYGDYQRTFGTTFMMNRYKEHYDDIAREEFEELTVPYTRSENYKEAELEKKYVKEEGVDYYFLEGDAYVLFDGDELDENVTYYTRSGEDPDYIYTEVQKVPQRDGDTKYFTRSEEVDPETGDYTYTEVEGNLQPNVTYYELEYEYTKVEKDPETGYYLINEGETYYHKDVESVIDEETCETVDETTYSEFIAPTPEEYDEQIQDLKESDKVWKKAMISQKAQEYLTSIAAKSFFEQGGESLLVIRAVDNDFKSGRAEVKTRNGEKVAFEIKTISQGETLNNWKGDPQDRTETTASIAGVIRTDGSLISGSKDNIRWEVADVDEETGTFSIYVRRGDDVDYDKTILEAFTGLNLDPDSANYISRRIGDQYQELLVEPTDNGEIAYVAVRGNYPNISKYIYIKDVNDIYGYFLADGFTRRGSADDETAIPEGTGKRDEDNNCIVNYPEDVANLLPQVCEGGFYDAKGKLFSTHADEAEALFFEDITAAKADPALNPGVKIQGIDPGKYDLLIDILENQDEYEINMISVPGLTVAFNTAQTDRVVSLAQKRGDLIAVVDLVGFGAMIGDVQQKATGCNSNYAATYWPWLQMYSSTGRLEWVPASVIIPGVYTYTDHVSAPWFAPAGMTRGSVQGVVQTERKLLKQNRDDLYKKNVNPIAILPGNGITIYGQKTLQKKASALDRVNVRRLMIELKRVVRNMASGILFEQNDKQLRDTFKKNLDNYLESVVKRRGLYGYKTVVEEVNTPDVIDRNEFRCKIWIQPTKVIEFIYIDFTITNTGVDFS